MFLIIISFFRRAIDKNKKALNFKYSTGYIRFSHTRGDFDPHSKKLKILF